MLLEKLLLDINIDIEELPPHVPECSRDSIGGFYTFLRGIWCCAHHLNLVLASLFPLVNDAAGFYDDHKSMQRWEEMSQGKHRRPPRAKHVWAKDQALSKVFGYFGILRGPCLLEHL